jgi:MinD superfamily P-loop ATPase
MKVVIASGKGGTGKTTIAVNLATYISKLNKQTVRLLDCDVEAPNAHLFINPNYSKEYKVTVTRPQVNKEKCTSCGKCVAVCNYNVFAKVKNEILTFPELCHSCGACYYFCPKQALSTKTVEIGKIQLAEHTKLKFGEGILNIGETAAPIIINALKQHCLDNDFNIIDAAPGTSCSVVKAIEGADVAILITEETPFGLHDLQLAIKLTAKLKIPTGVIINRAFNKNKLITNFCQKFNIPLIGKIPFQQEYAKCYSQGELIIEQFSELEKEFHNILQYIHKLKEDSPPIIAAHSEYTNQLYINKSLGNNQKENKNIELVIISGKGGTGKTTIAGAIAELMQNQTIVDSDVDAANLHLILNSQRIAIEDFIGGSKYNIDQNLCSSCGLCTQHCQFNAIDRDENNELTINKLKCEGCGFCAKVCPLEAILRQDLISGKTYISTTTLGKLSHAELEIGEANSGKLVAKVREQAKMLAQEHDSSFIVNDGPPGIGCPVISSITGADLVLIITEPTLAGIHDLTRTLELTQHFKIPALIVINKADLNIELASRIHNLVTQYKSQVIAEIPYDLNVVEALMQGKTIIRHGKGAAFTAIHKLWNELILKLKQINREKENDYSHTI